MPTTRGLISSNKLSFPFSLPSLFFSSEVSDSVGNASEIIKRTENASLASLCYPFSSLFFPCALTRFSRLMRAKMYAYIKCTFLSFSLSLIPWYITQYLIIERLSCHLSLPSPPLSSCAKCPSDRKSSYASGIYRYREQRVARVKIIRPPFAQATVSANPIDRGWTCASFFSLSCSSEYSEPSQSVDVLRTNERRTYST